MKKLTDKEVEKILKSLKTGRSQEEIFESIVKRFKEELNISKEEATTRANHWIRFCYKLIEANIENDRRENQRP